MSAPPAIPKGSTVLITGVNGYIGSHTADQLLLAGYNVRGSVRNVSRAQWIKDLFDEKYGAGRFDLVVVPKMNEEGAWDEAVKGVSGIVHTASNLSLSPNPHDVIPETISGTLSLLRAASLSSPPSTNPNAPLRFVYTSSAIATSFALPNTPVTITSSSWNDLASEMAWAPPPYPDERKWAVYAASKAESEKACWKFAQELEEKQEGTDKGRRIEFNSVLPSVNFGPSLHESQSSETLVWIRKIVAGDLEFTKNAAPPQWFVDVRDTARLHVAALTNPTVISERIFAYSETYNWSRILDILRKAYPDRTWPANIKNEQEDLSKIDEARRRSVESLRALGREEFIGLKESVRVNAEMVLAGK